MKLKYYFKIIANVILDFVYPKYCAICQKTITKYTSTALCDKCLKLDLVPKVVRDDRYSFDEAIGVIEYKDSAKEAMLNYKFEGVDYYAASYAHMMDKACKDRPYLKQAIMCPTPLSKSRDRDYNQTELVAGSLAAKWGSEYIPDLLYRCKEVNPLSKMKLSERRFSIRDAIDVNPRYDIYGKDIVVIDDIYTSGTTANECARTLKMYGARRVYILCAMYD